MAIIRRPPPPESVQAFEADRARPRRLPPSRQPAARSESLPAAPEAWPRYSVAAADLAQFRPLADAAVLESWSFFVSEGGALSVAEVGPASGSARVRRWSYGPINDEMLELAEGLPGSEALGGDNHELRILTVPALCLSALWLRNEGQGRSVVVPLAPTGGSLEPRRAYSEEDFVSILAPLAARRLARPDPT